MKPFEHQFEELYLSYFPRMYRFAREFTATDQDAKNVVQDVFLQLWEQRHTLEIQGAVAPFLFSCTRNKCMDYLRHRQTQEKYRRHALFCMQALQASEQDDQAPGSEELEAKVLRAVETLSDRAREVFLLNRTEGKKYREIALQLGISEKTVEAHMSTALKKIREFLEKD